MSDRVLHARFRWAGGEHRFALPMTDHNGQGFQRHGVEDPHGRLSRLTQGVGTVDDISGTIRGGLIGGGSFKLGAELDRAIKDYVLARPLADGACLARAVLQVAIYGLPAGLAEPTLEPGEIDQMITFRDRTDLDKAA